MANLGSCCGIVGLVPCPHCIIHNTGLVNRKCRLELEEVKFSPVVVLPQTVVITMDAQMHRFDVIS